MAVRRWWTGRCEVLMRFSARGEFNKQQTAAEEQVGSFDAEVGLHGEGEAEQRRPLWGGPAAALEVLTRGVAPDCEATRPASEGLGEGW